jgi:hypothetical protein
MAASFSDAWLVEYSGEHLMHELSMLWETAHTLSRYRQGSTEYTALLESFATHLRNLIEFFFYQESGDYVRAKHFFENSADWSPSRAREINDLHSRACNEVNHLTSNRKPGSPPDPWRLAQILDEIEPVAKEFGLKASDKKLHPKVRAFLEQPSNEMIVWIGNNVTHINVALQTPIGISFSDVTASTSTSFVVPKLVEPKKP